LDRFGSQFQRVPLRFDDLRGDVWTLRMLIAIDNLFRHSRKTGFQVTSSNSTKPSGFTARGEWHSSSAATAVRRRDQHIPLAVRTAHALRIEPHHFIRRNLVAALRARRGEIETVGIESAAAAHSGILTEHMEKLANQQHMGFTPDGHDGDSPKLPYCRPTGHYTYLKRTTYTLAKP
jgi:hypothetical protein